MNFLRGIVGNLGYIFGRYLVFCFQRSFFNKCIIFCWIGWLCRFLDTIGIYFCHILSNFVHKYGSLGYILKPVLRKPCRFCISICIRVGSYLVNRYIRYINLQKCRNILHRKYRILNKCFVLGKNQLHIRINHLL